MKFNLIRKVMFTAILSLVLISGCIVNNSDGSGGNDSNTNEQFTLTISLSSGVSGYPASGSYNYASGSTANYAYSLESGYVNLTVLLDGNAAASSGSILMNSNHTLTVTAGTPTATYDVRGSWTGTQTDSNGDPDPFQVTFSGSSATSGTTSGWVDDPSSVGEGTYTVTGATIHFDLWYGSVRNFQINGTFSDNNNMSGDWVWTNQSGDKFYGTWKLSR